MGGDAPTHVSMTDCPSMAAIINLGQKRVSTEQDMIMREHGDRARWCVRETFELDPFRNHTYCTSPRSRAIQPYRATLRCPRPQG